jgi:hypothetical protein
LDDGTCVLLLLLLLLLAKGFFLLFCALSTARGNELGP